ncbi:UNVERIFIED_CONTAM: hypothetical protein FKN15_064892 [Acipenser sinensis]
MAGGEPLAMKAAAGAPLLSLVKVEAAPAPLLQVVVVEEAEAPPLSAAKAAGAPPLPAAMAAGAPPLPVAKAAGAPPLLAAGAPPLLAVKAAGAAPAALLLPLEVVEAEAAPAALLLAVEAEAAGIRPLLVEMGAAGVPLGVPKIPGYTHQVVAQKLCDHMVQWLNPTKKTCLQMGEAMVVEQFCHVVGPGTQVWIRRHNPDMLEAAVKLAEDFEDSLVSSRTDLLTAAPVPQSSHVPPPLPVQPLSVPPPRPGWRPQTPPTPMGNLASPPWRPRMAPS